MPWLGPVADIPPTLWLVFATLLGLIVGSFANVCIHRIPRGESILTPGSHCPGCTKPIRPWDNVPLLSYAWLRGRCRQCGARIAPRYPAVEALSGALYLAAAAVFGPTLIALLHMAFLTALVVLALIDLDHHLLPDAITLPSIVVGLVVTLLPGWPVTSRSALASALGGYLAFLVVAKTFQAVRGIEGLGEGDWKMAAMLGAFLGWQRLLVTVFFASVAGTVVGLLLIAFRGKTSRFALPLGTFLGLAGIVAVFAGDPLFAWYRGLYR